MTIRRYSEDHDTIYNAQLQRLEDLYQVTGNAMELITSGTLASATNEISVDLGSTSWAFVTLRANLTLSSPENIYLWANRVTGSVSGAYYDYSMFITSAGASGSALANAVLAGYVDTTAATIEMTIFPHSLGFHMIGSCSANTGLYGLILYRLGGVYTIGSTPTSLQLRPNSATTTFSAGGTYRLEGVRA